MNPEALIELGRLQQMVEALKRAKGSWDAKVSEIERRIVDMESQLKGEA